MVRFPLSAIHASIVKMKPPEFLLKKGSTVYEFVGANDVMPEIRAARAHLEAL